MSPKISRRRLRRDSAATRTRSWTSSWWSTSSSITPCSMRALSRRMPAPPNRLRDPLPRLPRRWRRRRSKVRRRTSNGGEVPSLSHLGAWIRVGVKRRPLSLLTLALAWFAYWCIKLKKMQLYKAAKIQGIIVSGFSAIIAPSKNKIVDHKAPTIKHLLDHGKKEQF